MKKLSILTILFLSTLVSFGQMSTQVEMADGFRSSGKIYVVVATIVVVFIGLAIYLFLIDRKLTKLEKDTK